MHAAIQPHCNLTTVAMAFQILGSSPGSLSPRRNGKVSTGSWGQTSTLLLLGATALLPLLSCDRHTIWSTYPCYLWVAKRLDLCKGESKGMGLGLSGG